MRFRLPLVQGISMATSYPNFLGLLPTLDGSCNPTGDEFDWRNNFAEVRNFAKFQSASLKRVR